ncbi:MAG: alanine--tRNA ligase, partial [Legionellaceae bacterium]|nr:alanine--tRNA ligase [Legionellaceae bacterium]
MNSAEIRKAFVKYFTQRGHTAIPGSSLIPGQDPSLLFTNAGMVQFKDVFLGRVAAPEAPAVTVQPCLRAGGKHNDLENVGYTARHHTLFEMLGNFSFGQYFKREAIAYAWEFLTQVLHLPENRLWVTVYESDDETANIWLHEMKVSPDRFSRCGAADNFWAMGETGPCGPCTEIFYDHGPSVAGGPPGSPDADGDRYTEIWNLVFMQYNRDAAGVLHPLPKPAVDTGMGLERIAAVMQGVHSNYDIDIFQHLIAAIRGLEPSLKKAKTENRTSQQAIADHMRSITFLMAEGVVPSNEGRGYVLRRILRRAVRHGNQLGLSSPFLARLFPAMLDVMGEAYPLLKQQEKTILYWIEQEEQQFSKTLVQGLRILQEAVRGLKTTVFSGEEAFKLYDTYGFPLDLTQDVLREQGISVDVDGFERCMEAQRALSQSNTAFQSQMVDNIFDGVGSSFEGYEHSEYESKILRIVVDGQAAVEAS